MYPRPFSYHRAASLREAAGLLAELGPEAKLLAGGQSLIPLMKLRLAAPASLIDIGHIPAINYIQSTNGSFAFGALARHADIEKSDAAARIPILHDCAAGIADVQVRNWGTLVGSIAEADPTGDWAPVLLTLDTQIHCQGGGGERTVPMADFIRDAFTTALQDGEVISEIRITSPRGKSGGAYIAFKRCAPVYASASVAAQVTMEDGVCREARIYVGAIGLTPVHAANAERALRGQAINSKTAAAAGEAAMSDIDPQSDQRGSAEYKRALVRGLTAEAIQAAARRAAGERVEVVHHYA
jgi:carbon-monoxide dehydrogenase medium subunit